MLLLTTSVTVSIGTWNVWIKWETAIDNRRTRAEVNGQAEIPRNKQANEERH